MTQGLAFYIFSFFTILSAVFVITARNPVHSVLFLILTFFSTAGLFILLGAEFLAMILVIVYVGAVAVLFMFVVMMLDINFVKLRQGFTQYLPIGLLVGGVLVIELITIIGSHNFSSVIQNNSVKKTNVTDFLTNTHAIGELLYTDFIYVFQAAGLILLLAMVGAILLTHRKRVGVKKQIISEQLAINEETVKLTKVETGKGI